MASCFLIAPGRQSPSALPGMGRRRSVQLSAHRVLVSRPEKWPGRPQSIHRDPRRRHRPDDRAVSALP